MDSGKYKYQPKQIMQKLDVMLSKLLEGTPPPAPLVTTMNILKQDITVWEGKLKSGTDKEKQIARLILPDNEYEYEYQTEDDEKLTREQLKELQERLKKFQEEERRRQRSLERKLREEEERQRIADEEFQKQLEKERERQKRAHERAEREGHSTRGAQYDEIWGWLGGNPNTTPRSSRIPKPKKPSSGKKKTKKH